MKNFKLHFILLITISFLLFIIPKISPGKSKADPVSTSLRYVMEVNSDSEVTQPVKVKQPSDVIIRQLRDSLAESEKWRKKYEDLVTGAFVENERRNMNELQTQQKLLAQLAVKERTTLNWSVSAAIYLVLLLVVMFYLFYQRRQTRNKLQISQLQSKVLHSQLNPHFIFNALSSIRRYVQQYPELAESYLSKFSVLMRQVLENSREEKISLQEEIAMLENYMQLETLRLPNGFDYEISINESTDSANTMIPPMILQPVIENAIWHGLNSLDYRGKINLHFEESEDMLRVCVEDNGVGLNSNAEKNFSPEKKRSLGMQITRERLELMNRKTKSKGTLQQRLFEGGSQVNLTIPV